MSKKKLAFEIHHFSGREPWNDYISIAMLHKHAIVEGFLSTFSNRILAELYRSIASSKHSSLFVSKDDSGDILGFIAISFSTSSFYKDFLLGKGLLLSPLLISKIFSISFLKKLFETIFYPTRKNESDSIDSEILNFCVAEKCRGQGIGRLLFSSAEEEFVNNSVDEIKIVTGIDQKAAQRFYERFGAQLVGNVEVHKNTESLIYNYQLVKK